MPYNLQQKLLRVLQDGSFYRVGGNELIHSNARIITATNQNLKKMMNTGEFRPDLYFRINTFPIHIPPLRKRKEDIGELTDYFIQKYSESDEPLTYKNDFLKVLKEYSWPGNVRELENAIRKAIVMSNGENAKELKKEYLPQDVYLKSSWMDDEIESFTSEPIKETMARVEKAIIKNALHKHKGNISLITRELKISRPTIYTRMGKYNIDIKQFV